MGIAGTSKFVRDTVVYGSAKLSLIPLRPELTTALIWAGSEHLSKSAEMAFYNISEIGKTP